MGDHQTDNDDDDDDDDDDVGVGYHLIIKNYICWPHPLCQGAGGGLGYPVLQWKQPSSTINSNCTLLLNEPVRCVMAKDDRLICGSHITHFSPPLPYTPI